MFSLEPFILQKIINLKKVTLFIDTYAYSIKKLLSIHSSLLHSKSYKLQIVQVGLAKLKVREITSEVMSVLEITEILELHFGTAKNAATGKLLSSLPVAVSSIFVPNHSPDLLVWVRILFQSIKFRSIKSVRFN